MIGRSVRVGFITLLSFLVLGCATVDRNEFTKLAQVGSGFSVAVDQLLVAAGTAQVDSTSWTLVAEKQTTGMDDETYHLKSNEDVARLVSVFKQMEQT